MSKPLNNAHRTLIRGARILTQDPSLGELRGDILIAGTQIADIGMRLDVHADETIEAGNMLALPGFIDTHRHTWETAMRHIGVGWDFLDYLNKFLIPYGNLFTPEDVYAANLLGAVSALESGITTLRDESHIQNTPQHTEAAIQALRDSGIRAVFDYGWPALDMAGWLMNSERLHPEDIRRVRREILSDDNALVTLNMMLRGPEMTTMDVAKADLSLMRDLGLRGCLHVGCGEFNKNNPGVVALHHHKLMGPDLTYIHCCTCSDDELRMIRDSGGTVSVAATIDANMPGLGIPATGRMLKVGLRPSLSVDVEVSAAGDMFTVMRAALTGQQMEVLHNPALAERSARFDAADLLQFATIEGARACGLDGRTGSLTPGKEADLILIRADDLNLAPVTDAAGAIVGGAHPGNVDSVFVAGRPVKRNGKMLSIDIPRILRLAEQSRDRLLAARAAHA